MKSIIIKNVNKLVITSLVKYEVEGKKKMKKFYLFCSAGMSTSMLAKKMQNCANQHNLKIEIKAFSISTMYDIVKKENPDCILLGPQVRYLLDETKSKYNPIPVMDIDMSDYGKMDGEKVLKSAILLYKRSNK